MKNKKTFLCAFAALTFILISCKKEHYHHPNHKNSEKLLTANDWIIEEITSSQSNELLYYKRGGQDNNVDFTHNSITFDENGTGNYTDGSNLYNITWQFTNSDKTELSYFIQDYANGSPAPGLSMEVKLENVYLSHTSFKYAEIYTNENGVSAVSSVHRIPAENKPE
jgi:hypothetical protein